MPKRLTTEDFILIAHKVHYNKYDYSLTDYKMSKLPVKIICKEHGVFEQEASKHMRGSGCLLCGFKSAATKHRLSLDLFITKAKSIHGSKYDYSLVVYRNNKTKVKITCPAHGVFEQTPAAHLKGQNCPTCSHRVTNILLFIKKAQATHGHNYDYRYVVYLGKDTKVKINCPQHGIFEQTPNNHYRHGCPQCAIDTISIRQTSSTSIFIHKANIVHRGAYDYSETYYISNKFPVKIICPEHGVFTQSPDNHLAGQRCPLCKLPSKGIQKIKSYLSKNNILFKQEYKVMGCMDKRVLPFDFILFNESGLVGLVEFDGIQHYQPISLWGGFKALRKTQLHDTMKTLYCQNNNIPLLRIPYWQEANIEVNIKNFLISVK